ncbi:MAG: C45 family peptidase [Myxococcota bacterium]
MVDSTEKAPLELVELSGSPRAMGRAYGESLRDSVAALAELRFRNAMAQARLYGGRRLSRDDLLDIARRCLPEVQDFDPTGWEELSGIAEGANLSREEIWAMNALTDVRDIAAFGFEGEEACTAVLVAPERAEGGTAFFGQTWDLSTDNMPFVRLVRRRPIDGPSTLAVTLVGCLSLIGLNDAGVAVGTTNLRATDSRPGVGYLDVIHRALGSRNAREAARRIESAPRAAAHYYWVGQTNMAGSLECTARRAELEWTSGVRVQTNHMRTSLAAQEVRGTPMESSRHRLERMEALLAEEGGVSPSDLRRFLGDTQGGELAIDRRDFAGISTNAVVVIEPGEGSLSAVHGPASEGCWYTWSV